MKALTRILMALIVLGVLLWIFAPRIFNNAANTFLSSADAQAQGLAQYIPAGATSSGKGDLQVQLNGLTPSTTYDITLDQGACGSTGQDLGSVTSDSNGNFYIEVPLASLDMKSTWYVDVHQQNAFGTSVACGQLQTNQDASSQIINAPLSGPNDFGPQPSPTDQSQGTAPNTITNSNSTPSGLPNTGANPGNNQQYNNSKYPRKY